MNVRPSILCPVDFSDPSAGALRYAAAIATHFATRLIVLTVEDPLLTEAVDLGTGVRWNPDDSRHELEQFAARTFGPDSPTLATLEYDVAVGKPAGEILRVARERSCDLIVISTHGLTGIRKLFFGSTTERVLRETTRPVLVTPSVDPGPISLDDAKRLHPARDGSRGSLAGIAASGRGGGRPGGSGGGPVDPAARDRAGAKSVLPPGCTSPASRPTAAPWQTRACRRSSRPCRRGFTPRRCWSMAIRLKNSRRSFAIGRPAWW